MIKQLLGSELKSSLDLILPDIESFVAYRNELVLLRRKILQLPAFFLSY